MGKEGKSDKGKERRKLTENLIPAEIRYAAICISSIHGLSRRCQTWRWEGYEQDLLFFPFILA